MTTVFSSVGGYSSRALRLTIFLAGVVLAHAGAGLHAATAANPPAAAAPAANAESTEVVRTSGADRRFLLCAAEANLSEIRLSERALAQADHPEVRRMAEQILRQHLKTGEELQALAARRGIELSPKEYNHRAVYRLSQKEGRDFDEAYVDCMVEGHKDTAKRFEKAAEKCADAELRAFASKTLPTLQAHLQHARQLEEKLF